MGTSVQPKQQAHSQNGHALHQPTHVDVLDVGIVVPHIPVVSPHLQNNHNHNRQTEQRRINKARQIDLGQPGYRIGHREQNRRNFKQQDLFQGHKPRTQNLQ